MTRIRSSRGDICPKDERTRSYAKRHFRAMTKKMTSSKYCMRGSWRERGFLPICILSLSAFERFFPHIPPSFSPEFVKRDGKSASDQICIRRKRTPGKFSLRITLAPITPVAARSRKTNGSKFRPRCIFPKLWLFFLHPIFSNFSFAAWNNNMHFDFYFAAFSSPTSWDSLSSLPSAQLKN